MIIEELIAKYGEPHREEGTDSFYEMWWESVYVLISNGEVVIEKEL